MKRWPNRGWMSPRVQCFVWKILNHRLPTRMFLAERGVAVLQIQDNCVCCTSGPETQEHLLAACPSLQPLLQNLCRFLWISLRQGDYEQIQQLLINHNSNSLRKQTLQMVVAYTLWTWWKARNELNFQQKDLDFNNIWRNAHTQIYEQLLL